MREIMRSFKLDGIARMRGSGIISSFNHTSDLSVQKSKMKMSLDRLPSIIATITPFPVPVDPFPVPVGDHFSSPKRNNSASLGRQQDVSAQSFLSSSHSQSKDSHKKCPTYTHSNNTTSGRYPTTQNMISDPPCLRPPNFLSPFPITTFPSLSARATRRHISNHYHISFYRTPSISFALPLICRFSPEAKLPTPTSEFARVLSILMRDAVSRRRAIVSVLEGQETAMT